jgi:uncharacterized protein (DUF924 family)
MDGDVKTSAVPVYPASVEARIDDIIAFWLGTASDKPSDVIRRWFTKDTLFDDEIRSRFGDDLEIASRGGYDAWAHGDARSVLAYVILTDQLTRNAFRDSGRAFALDEKALVASLDAQSRGIDTSLGFLERYVLYLPMMHAEDKEVQARCVSVFATLASDASKAGEDEIAGMLRGAHDYAVRHQVIVERFGRFPHRNSLLDRTSTPDEAMFLLEPGAGF